MAYWDLGTTAAEIPNTGPMNLGPVSLIALMHLTKEYVWCHAISRGFAAGCYPVSTLVCAGQCQRAGGSVRHFLPGADAKTWLRIVRIVRIAPFLLANEHRFRPPDTVSSTIFFCTLLY